VIWSKHLGIGWIGIGRRYKWSAALYRRYGAWFVSLGRYYLAIVIRKE